MKLNNRIEYQLPRPMISDVTAPFDVNKVHAGIGQKGGRYVQVIPVAPSADGKNRGVLLDENHVPVDFPRDPGFEYFELKCVGSVKIHEAQISTPGGTKGIHERPL